MDLILKKVVLLLSMFCAVAFVGCKDNDEEKEETNGGETPKEEEDDKEMQGEQGLKRLGV